MTLQLVIRCIGVSHLLQPPLTLWLARRLRLAESFRGLAPLPAHVLGNMAVASVALPTTAGLVIGFAANDIVTGGAVRLLAWIMSGFWTWRHWRQMILAPLLPPSWRWGLAAIFVVQGPLLAAVLWRCSTG